MTKEIFATAERQRVLKEFGIKYCVDQDLNLVFKSKEEEKKAVRVLKAALEL